MSLKKKDEHSLWSDYRFQQDFILTAELLMPMEGEDTFASIWKAYKLQGKILKELKKKGAFKR